jgi:hypothetical protein
MQYNKSNNQQHKGTTITTQGENGLGEYLGVWWGLVAMWWNSSSNTMEQPTNILDKKKGDNNRIYNFIVIIFARILTNVQCDFFKCKKWGHLNSTWLNFANLQVF